MGLVVRRQRNLSRASAYHEQALALFQQVEDRVGEERCLNNIGNIHWLRGETEKAMAWYEMALALARQVGERRDEGNCLNNLGAVHWQVGDYSRALRFYQQALLVHQETKDRYNEGIGRSNIGEVRRCLGEFDQAAGDLEGGLAICDAIGDREGKLYVLHLLGLTYTDLGRFDEALLRHQQELYLAQRVADRAAEATAQYGMGLACLGSGSIAEALSWLGRARALHEELGQQDELNADLCALSRVYLISGDVPTARICSSQAIALLGKVSADAQIAVRTDYIHYRAMAAQGESMETVRNYLEQAYHLLAEQARRISDAEDRRSFLRNVPLHREIALEATAHSIAKDEVAQLE
jgi:tetratricopeptide (TPR) repeat protein